MGWYPGKAVAEVYKAYQEGRTARTEARNERRSDNTASRQEGRTGRQGNRQQGRSQRQGTRAFNRLQRIQQGNDLASAINRRIGGGGGELIPYDTAPAMPEWALPVALMAGLAFLGIMLTRKG